MIVLHSPHLLTSNSVTSSAAGYPDENVVYYSVDDDGWFQPWKKWRSTSLSDQTFSLYYSGRADITCFAIFGANFSSISIYNGATYTLAQNKSIGDYRGVFSISADPSPVSFVVSGTPPGGEAYFEISTIMVGVGTTLTSYPSDEIDKSLVLPRAEYKLIGGQTKVGSLRLPYHNLLYKFDDISLTKLDELRAVVKTVGQNTPFAIYDDLGEREDSYLARLSDDFFYTQTGYNQYSAALSCREIS